MVSFSLSQRHEILGVSFYPKKAPDIAFSEIMHAQIKHAFFFLAGIALVFRMRELKSKKEITINHGKIIKEKCLKT